MTSTSFMTAVGSTKRTFQWPEICCHMKVIGNRQGTLNKLSTPIRMCMDTDSVYHAIDILASSPSCFCHTHSPLPLILIQILPHHSIPLHPMQCFCMQSSNTRQCTRVCAHMWLRINAVCVHVCVSVCVWACNIVNTGTNKYNNMI